MHITRKQGFGALALATAAALAFFLIPRGIPVDLVVATQGPLVQTVVMSGRIANSSRTEISSQSTARIEAITVREGDLVKAGQVLVQLRDDEARAALRQAEGLLAEAQARIRQLQTVQAPVSEQQLAQARANQQQAQSELARARELVAQGFVSQSKLDDASRVAQAAEAALLAATAQALGNRPDGVELALARTRLEQASAAHRAAAARLDGLSLRAPVNGKVIIRTADPGDTAQAGRSLLTLTGDGQTRIEASVDEKNLRWLSIGQKASAVADAFPQQPFLARLDYIAPRVDALRGTVDVRLAVETVPDFLRTDMTVSVEIVTNRVASAILLPTDGLRSEPDGSAFVMLLRDGRAHKLAVKKGITGTGTTQILEGLSAGDQVISPGSEVGDGDRVRERSRRPAQANMQPIPGLTN